MNYIIKVLWENVWAEKYISRTIVMTAKKLIRYYGSELLQVQNFCNFQKCHFWKIFLKIMESAGDDANSDSHEDQKFFKRKVPVEIQNPIN